MQVAIIGAGLVGRMLAWRLIEQGAHVTLIDANTREFKGTGLVAAAMIAPGTEAVTTEPLVEKLGRRSMALWQPWLDQLSASTGHSIYYAVPGTLVVAHPQDQADWQQFMQHAQAKLERNAFRHLDQTELASISTDLALNFDRAGFFPDEAILDNQQLYAALAEYFEQKTVPWHESSPLNSLADNGRLKGFESSFDWVFDCRGNGAREAQASLRSVRGEVIRVIAPEVNIRHAVRLMHPRYPLYIAPKQGHHYVIGATQIESDDDSPVTVRSGLELLSALYSLHKGFAEATIVSLDVGCRPAYDNNLPRIQTQNKLIRINGLYRHGYLFVPTLVEEALAFIRSEPLNFPEIFHP